MLYVKCNKRKMRNIYSEYRVLPKKQIIHVHNIDMLLY